MLFAAGALLSLTSFAGIANAQRTNSSSEKSTEALNQRVEKRKDAAKVRLNALEKQAIQSRCKASQGHLRRLSSRIVGISVSRGDVYTMLKNRLHDVSKRLEAKGIGTAELNNQITELEAKITTFNTDLQAYEQLISDLSSMDCAADPEGYRASLDEAKKTRTETVQAGVAIHDYLKNTIKPTLQSLRTQLGENEQEENNGQ